MKDNGPPFRWDPERRALLRADLDAAMLHVYGVTREEAEHVLDSFPVVRKYEERDLGEYRTRRLVLDAFDRMTAATAGGGRDWTPLAAIPAGRGPRHTAPKFPHLRSATTDHVSSAPRAAAPEEIKVNDA
jgi:hypothetical protein